jgi:hypothetical protein
VAKFKTVPGFVKATRLVCKSEWAYETEFVFDSLASFKAYDSSAFRAKEVLPLLAESVVLTGAQPYAGVRVFDEM